LQPFRQFLVSTRLSGLTSNHYSAHAESPRCSRRSHLPTHVQTQLARCCAFREKDSRKSLPVPATSNRVWFPSSALSGSSSGNRTARFSPSRSRTPHLRNPSPNSESATARVPRGNLLIHCGHPRYSPRSSSAATLEGVSWTSTKNSQAGAALVYTQKLGGQSLCSPYPSFSDKHHTSRLPLGPPFPTRFGCIALHFLFFPTLNLCFHPLAALCSSSSSLSTFNF